MHYFQGENCESGFIIVFYTTKGGYKIEENVKSSGTGAVLCFNVGRDGGMFR